MIVVTHEMGFARRAANRVVFMDDGRIVEVGRPRGVLHQPAVATAPRTSCPRSSTTDRRDSMRITAMTRRQRRGPFAALASGGGLGRDRPRRRGPPRGSDAALDVPAGTTMARAATRPSDHRRHQVRPARFRAARTRTDKPEGFDVEIAKIIAAPARHHPTTRSSTETVSANREPFIQNGQVDIVVATYTINDTRKRGRRLRRARTTSPVRTSWCKGQHRRSRAPTTCGQEGLLGRGIDPGAEHPDELPQAPADRCSTSYSKCADALKNGRSRRSPPTTSSSPACRQQPERLQARRQAVHRGALRHRPEEGRRPSSAPSSTTCSSSRSRTAPGPRPGTARPATSAARRLPSRRR